MSQQSNYYLYLKTLTDHFSDTDPGVIADWLDAWMEDIEIHIKQTGASDADVLNFLIEKFREADLFSLGVYEADLDE